MDLKGSLVNTDLQIIPSKNFIKFLKTINITKDVSANIVHIINNEDKCKGKETVTEQVKLLQLTDTDYENLKNVKKIMQEHDSKNEKPAEENDSKKKNPVTKKKKGNEKDIPTQSADLEKNKMTIYEAEDEGLLQYEPVLAKQFLTTQDLDWLYVYMKTKRGKGEKLPYLHELLQDSDIRLPPNKILKRNPDLEARCVKLRAQQEAREYRKMTKGVDNVRIRFPEDSISYQMKQINRHLIAIGQFLLSIFAGFLFGFRGVEWIVGNLDFGFRLLLGVMCALVIALAEIYFLAKKLNEELSVPETVQLGGPPIYANNENVKSKDNVKEHQD